MELSSELFGLIPQNFSRKKCLIFFLEKTCSEKVSYIFRKHNFLIFSLKECFLYFGKVIFRTLTYLELEAYSEPAANLKNFLYFRRELPSSKNEKPTLSSPKKTYKTPLGETGCLSNH